MISYMRYLYKPHNTSEQYTTPPPVSSDIVASYFSASHVQASTAPIMIAPFIVVPGPSTIGSSQQESVGMAQGTNISGAQSRSLMFGNNFSQPPIIIPPK